MTDTRKPARVKRAIHAPATREECEALVDRICEEAIRADALKAEMNESLKRVREQYAPLLLEIETTLKMLLPRVEAWALENPDAFAGRKSCEMGHGTVGWRTGQPRLTFRRGASEEQAIAFFLASAPDYLRQRVELDRERIIAARGTLGEENLATAGIKIAQAESFFVDPKIENGGNP